MVHNKYKAGFVNPLHLSNNKWLANFFTEPLPSSLFYFHLSKLDILSLSPTWEGYEYGYVKNIAGLKEW